MADDVAELPALGAKHGHAPARLRHHVDDVGDGELRRGGKPVLDVLVALAEHLEIERKHQRGAVRGLGAVDKPADEIPVPHDVELEHEGGRAVGGHILDRADAHRRQAERDAEPGGRTCRKDLAIRMLHAGEAGGGERHGHRHIHAEHLRADGALVDVDRHALAQLVPVEVGRVGAVGALCPGARVRIVIEHARHAPLGEHAQVLDAGDGRRHIVSP